MIYHIIFIVKVITINVFIGDQIWLLAILNIYIIIIILNIDIYLN